MLRIVKTTEIALKYLSVGLDPTAKISICTYSNYDRKGKGYILA